MSTVYLAWACTQYEGSDVMRIFAAEADAQAFIKLCEDHQQKRPHTPSVTAEDSEWDAWNAAMEAWQRDEPEGFRDYDGGYRVEERPVEGHHERDVS